MLRKLTIALVVFVLVLGAGAALGGTSADTGCICWKGPWQFTLVPDGSRGYLLNTETGELWQVYNDTKVLVRELKRDEPR